ncbi:MurR/RpiR family transcriptional regulator [Micromonospora inyonensis]|uniref:Helix-turn-helix domain-containing protein, rpiR family n=1 Tax=Micromonospora inyonensis TaxID=47866 RepID=A0A1C6RR62_9ACTN|nr:MurR/RpiR family transcriptional regulator [Micromonospora inyonensis]SCL19707.1 Helix-turn-helix domain-containing protein, rpiR family [Micromonospora inyonensis]
MNGTAAIAAAPSDRLLDLFHGARLTPMQRRIAHCLVQHAGSVAYLSAAEVAELAGVSQPSVTRFAVALGHDGCPALRRRLRELTGAGGTDLVFDLHTAPMALAMVVLQAICDAAPTDTQARLEAFEASAARRQLFLG